MQDTQEYSNQTETTEISVYCDCCDNQSRGTKDELKNRGWGFGGGSEFCPECNY